MEDTESAKDLDWLETLRAAGVSVGRIEAMRMRQSAERPGVNER